jgi:hypothetical protein
MKSASASSRSFRNFGLRQDPELSRKFVMQTLEVIADPKKQQGEASASRKSKV